MLWTLAAMLKLTTASSTARVLERPRHAHARAQPVQATPALV